MSWLRTSPTGEPARPWAWVALGLLGVLIVVFGQLLDLPGLIERAASWWRPLITVPGHALLLLAWWQLGPRWRHQVVTAAVWSLPMLFTFPLHSRDAYAYAAQGWIAARGLDPYKVFLGEADAPGLLVGVHWHGTTAVYPAGSVELFAFLTRLTGGDYYWTTVVLRLPSVAALAILVFTLPALARRFGVDERLVLWFGVANPIILVQWIGGVHNDALMVALGCVALLAATDLAWRGWRGLLVAGILLGLAVSVKQSAALFGLGVVAVAWAAGFPQRRGWSRLVAVALVPGTLTIVTFLLVSLRLGLGWRAPTAGNPIAATSNAPLSWVASFLRYHELLQTHDLANTIITGLSSLLIVGAIVLLWMRLGPTGDRAGQPMVFLVGVLVASWLLAPAMQPWYLTWVLPLYALCGLDADWHRIALVVIVGFSVLPGLQDVLAPYVAMAVVIIPLHLLLRWLRREDLEVLPTPAPRLVVKTAVGSS